MKIVLLFCLLAGAWSFSTIDDRTSPNAYKIHQAFISATSTNRFECPFPKNVECKSGSKYRTFNGRCNNLQQPLYGSFETPHKRFLNPVYNDGFGTPRRKARSENNLPNPRVVSKALDSDNLAFEKIWTHAWVIFGQFLTHDISATALTNSKKKILTIFNLRRL